MCATCLGAIPTLQEVMGVDYNVAWSMVIINGFFYSCLLYTSTPGGIFEACAKEITVWGRKDLKDVEDSNLGLKGSPTQIAKASDKVRKGKGETVNLDVAESVDYIMNKLQEKHII